MNTIIEYGVNETQSKEYVGFVRVFDKAKWVWSETTGIYRLDYDDALEDAHQLATSYLEQNKGIELSVVEE